MNSTNKVRLISPGTDISFSIKDIPSIKCAGKMNIPDGEVFTAPVRESVNGKITYNLDTIYNGIRFSKVSLTVKNGKIVNAISDGNTEELNAILDTDSNARYFGEFAIGVNPHITEPFNDILFDEKMCGSIHLTPGACYEDEAPNGNKSAIHWDMVLSMQPQHGGGEIYFDDKLIRKDGRFVVKELKALNPENLI
jgi:aminopeptidase